VWGGSVLPLEAERLVHGGDHGQGGVGAIFAQVFFRKPSYRTTDTGLEEVFMMDDTLVSAEGIENAIIVVRGQKVILDETLASLYGVTTKRLNEQLKRNAGRFPQDFLLRLTASEFDDLRSRFATSSRGWGGRRTPPYAFTEHGAIMAASVLNSPKAIEMSVLVVRAFVKLRNLLAAHRELAVKIDELERKLSTHDQKIAVLFEAIRGIMVPHEKSNRRIGFSRERPEKTND
jgi:hypothetical protein